MTQIRDFQDRLKLPVIAAPMFLASGPELVISACRAGIVGTFPALNLRSTEALAAQIELIRESLSPDDAPFGVNLIVRRSNERLEADLREIVRGKVPLVITSLGAVREVVEAVHDYGGLVFHDVTNRLHAEKAAAAGVDGIIAVAAGAGGHAGLTSPFALLAEVRRAFDGVVLLGGAISSGADIAAARAMGADLAYMGTRFLATMESTATPEHKEMILRGGAGDIVYTPTFSGVPASYLKASVRAAGLDPDNLAPHSTGRAGGEAKPWRDIWSAGQGIAGIEDVPTVAELCARLTSEFDEAISVLENSRFRRRPAPA